MRDSEREKSFLIQILFMNSHKLYENPNVCMYQTKYTVDILIVEKISFTFSYLSTNYESKCRLFNCKSKYSFQIQLQIYHGFVVTYSKTTAEFLP